MKTKIMSVSGIPSGLRSDLKVFNSVSLEQVNLISEVVSNLEDFARVNDDQVRLEISRNTNLSADKFLPVIRAFSYIRGILTEYGDNIEQFTDDLLNENLISKETGEKIVKGFYNLSQKPIFQSHLKIDVAYAQVFPVYQHSNIRCLLLPTFDKEYTSKDIPDAYSPKISDLLPATVLTIAVEGPEEMKHISFVVTEPDLDRFINDLQLVRKQLQALKSHVKS